MEPEGTFVDPLSPPSTLSWLVLWKNQSSLHFCREGGGRERERETQREREREDNDARTEKITKEIKSQRKSKVTIAKRKKMSPISSENKLLASASGLHI